MNNHTQSGIIGALLHHYVPERVLSFTNTITSIIVSNHEMCQEFTSKMKVPVLKYYGMDAALAGENRHPQDHLRELGVKYGYASCHSVADVWFFWMPYGNLDALPEWLKSEQITVDPIQFWGDDNEESVAMGQNILNIHSKMDKI